MKKKIIVLIMVIPIILIFTTNLIVSSTNIIVDVPVSSVDVIGSHYRIIDLVSSDRDLAIDARITPKEAKAKITYQIFEVEGQKEADVEIVNGKVIPHSLGAVNVKVSAGDKSDIVTFLFISSLPVLGVSPDQNEDEVDLITFTESLIKVSNDSLIDLRSYLPSDETFVEKYNMTKQEFVDNSVLQIDNALCLVIEDEFTWKLKAIKMGSQDIRVRYKCLLINGDGEIKVKTKEIMMKVVVSAS